MFIEKAYEQRETLSDRDLERLAAALRDKVERYEVAIENYPPDRMEKHGFPFLHRLQFQLVEVNRTLTERKKRSE